MPAPSEKYDPAIEELAAEFAAVTAAIMGAIAAAASVAGTPSPLALSSLRFAIAEELGLLLRASALWVSRWLPQVYSDGVGEQIAAPGGPLEPGEPGPPDLPEPDAIEGEAVATPDPHAEAIRAASEELMLALQHAVNGIGVTANARLEDIRRRNIARALAQDAPLANALDQQLAGEMEDAGITFQDRSGRNWNGETYARMVLRTHVATTLNVGAINRAIEGGSQYVRVSDGGPGDVDEPCLIANGQVWHVAIAAANLLEHPNCRRSFAPLEPGYSGPVDRDIERLAA